MRIQVTDLDTDETTTYEYSSNNWRKQPACMVGGLVHMWAPQEVQKGSYVITSGRKWILLDK